MSNNLDAYFPFILLLPSSFLQIKQPILFLSGLQDEMVPPSHMQMLYAKAAARNKHCKFVEFPTGMHMDTWLAGGDQYWRSIQEFLAEHVRKKKESETSGNDNGILSLWIFQVLIFNLHQQTDNKGTEVSPRKICIEKKNIPYISLVDFLSASYFYLSVPSIFHLLTFFWLHIFIFLYQKYCSV